MPVIHRAILRQLILLATCAGGEMNFLVYQSPPSLTAAAGESVTLSCAVGSNVALPLTGSVHWTRGTPDGYKLRNSPFYEGRVKKSDADSFANNRIFVNIADLIEKDSDIYYCNINLMTAGQGHGNGTKLEVKGRIQDKAARNMNVTPVVVTALGLSSIAIALLTARLIWTEKVIQRMKRRHSEVGTMHATANPSPRRQTNTISSGNKGESLHYAQVMTRPEREMKRMNREEHQTDYATIK